MRANAWISCKLFIFVSTLLTLDLDNFHFIQVDFVAEGGFFIDNTHWIRKILVDFVHSWISILDPPITEYYHTLTHSSVWSVFPSRQV